MRAQLLDSSPRPSAAVAAERTGARRTTESNSEFIDATAVRLVLYGTGRGSLSLRQCYALGKKSRVERRNMVLDLAVVQTPRFKPVNSPTRHLGGPESFWRILHLGDDMGFDMAEGTAHGPAAGSLAKLGFARANGAGND
jgi:hypothetical protein